MPPEIDDTGTPSWSWTQRNPSAGSGAPVEPTQRSRPGAGVTPALRQAIRNGADTPKIVMPVSSARSHSVSIDGAAGSPSNVTIVAPTSSPDTSRFHIIQPVVENQKKTSSGRRSWCSDRSLRCSATTPPWPWTIAFGSPVVPELKRT